MTSDDALEVVFRAVEGGAEAEEYKRLRAAPRHSTEERTSWNALLDGLEALVGEPGVLWEARGYWTLGVPYSADGAGARINVRLYRFFEAHRRHAE